MSNASIQKTVPDRWNLVAGLSPRLKSHISISRHRFRGQISYILEDALTKNRYRFSREAYEVAGRLTGNHTIEELYKFLHHRDGNGAPTQESVVDILIQLSRMEALADNSLKDIPGAVPLHRTKQGNRLIDQVKNSPLFLRLPLFNPNPILNKYQHLTRLFFNKPFFITLIILLTAAASTLFLHWPELSHNLVDTIFTRHNLIILWLLYPVVKTIHEFAHGFSVKHFGGDVTEMGLMLLLFIPVPYVNASDSASLPRKWQRIIVAGSGILAELTLASLALLLWTVIEPGFLRSIAFNTMLICGVSTLIFNGNPLVRFDGYYILSDLVEIPNLATRSAAYLWYHILRLLTGLEIEKPAEPSLSERRWFILYGISAFCYRLTIYGSIFYLFASKLGPIGAVIGVLGIAQLIFLPFKKRILPILQSPRYRAQRSKFITLFGLYLTIAITIITLLPLPYTTPVEGVVWSPEESLIKMQTSGVVTSMVATPGQVVAKGEILFLCEDAELHHTMLLLESQLTELRLKEAAAFAQNPFEARIISEKISDITMRLEDKKQQEQDLTVTSPVSGNFITEQSGELVGKYFSQGETIGFIQSDATIVRTLISQADIDPILENLSHIEIFIDSTPEKAFTGTILSEHPHATYKLPSETLATIGGGRIITNPEDSTQLTTFEEMFQLDIKLNTPVTAPFAESRAYIRFYHGYKPLSFRWARRLQQLFLTQFRG